MEGKQLNCCFLGYTVSRPQLDRAKFVYKRSFDVESRPSHRTVVVDVTNVATVVDIASKQQLVSTRPQNYLIKDYIILGYTTDRIFK